MLAVRPFVANFNVMDCLRDGDADVFVFRSLRKGHVHREMLRHTHHVTGRKMAESYTNILLKFTLSIGGIQQCVGGILHCDKGLECR